jgi:zinc protease
VPADAAAFHEMALERGGWLVVAGRIEADEVAAFASDRFAALAAPSPARFSPPAAPAPAAQRHELTTRARDQAHLFVGRLTVDRLDPDYEALELAGVALGAGAGLSGRIPNRLRDREGLAYSASADLVAGAGLDAGRFFAYLGTAPENLIRAELAIREELDRLLASGPTDDEIAAARSYLLGREPFRRETARQWADLAAHGRVLGLPLEDERWRRERLLAPDRAAIEAALRRHVAASDLAVTVGLPAGEGGE